MPSSTMAYYTKVYELNRAGMPEDKAVETAYRLTYEQDDRTKQMIAAQVRDKDYMKGRDKAAQANINSFYTLGGFSSPGRINRASITVNTCGITRRFMTPTLPKPVVTQNWLRK